MWELLWRMLALAICEVPGGWARTCPTITVERFNKYQYIVTDILVILHINLTSLNISRAPPNGWLHYHPKLRAVSTYHRNPWQQQNERPSSVPAKDVIHYPLTLTQ